MQENQQVQETKLDLRIIKLRIEFDDVQDVKIISGLLNYPWQGNKPHYR